MTGHFDYISDNPFRLCSVGAETLLPELRRKANSIATQAKVGIVPDVPLAHFFGNEEIERCADIVRQLNTDARLRTLYRIFWPLYLPPSSGTSYTLTDLDPVAKRGKEPGYEGQLDFLLHWYPFIVERRPEQLDAALSGFWKMYNDEQGDAILIGMLEREGERESKSIVHSVQDETRKFLLNTATEIAIEEWQAGHANVTGGIIQAIQHSQFYNDERVQAFRRLVDYGDRLIETFCHQLEEYADQSQANEYWDAKPFEDAFELIARYQELIYPVAESLDGVALTEYPWKDTIDAQIESLVDWIRHFAHDSFQKKDLAPARKALEFLLKYPQAHPWREAIAQDLAVLREVEEHIALSRKKVQYVVHAAPATGDLIDVEWAPKYFAFMGCGVRLLGWKNYPSIPEWYSKELWLCFFYFPLWPLREYLVSDAPDGRLIFHKQRSTPEKESFAHRFTAPLLGRWLAFAGILLFFYYIGSPQLNKWIASSRNSDNIATTASPSLASSSLSTMDRILDENAAASDKKVSETTPPADETETQTAVIDVQAAREERLNQEMEKLDAEITALRDELDSEQHEIDGLREELGADLNRLDRQRANVNRYDEEEVDNYNAALNRMRRKRTSFNKRVDAFNAKVKKSNNKVQRLKEVRAALDSMP